MRQETQGVTETLIKNATEEFLEYGFTKASLRRIAGSSGVSTNSIYTRFKDKEGLFKAIVDDAAAGLMNIYLESIQKLYQKVLHISILITMKASLSIRKVFIAQ